MLNLPTWGTPLCSVLPLVVSYLWRSLPLGGDYFFGIAARLDQQMSLTHFL